MFIAHFRRRQLNEFFKIWVQFVGLSLIVTISLGSMVMFWMWVFSPLTPINMALVLLFSFITLGAVVSYNEIHDTFRK